MKTLSPLVVTVTWRAGHKNISEEKGTKAKGEKERGRHFDLSDYLQRRRHGGSIIHERKVQGDHSEWYKRRILYRTVGGVVKVAERFFLENDGFLFFLFISNMKSYSFQL